MESSSPAAQPAKARQAKLIEKIVANVINIIMHKDPDTGMSDEEVAMITTTVKKRAFSGEPISESDMKALANRVANDRKRSSAPSTAAASSKRGAAAAPPQGSSSLPELPLGLGRDASGGSRTPSLCPSGGAASSNAYLVRHLQLPPRAASSIGSQRSSVLSRATTRGTDGGGATSVGGGTSVRSHLRRRAADSRSLQALSELVSLSPERGGDGSASEANRLARGRPEDDPWARKALEEKAAFIEELSAKREVIASLRREQQRDLLAQIEAKKQRKKQVRIALDDEQRQRVAIAEASLRKEAEERERKRQKQVDELARAKAESAAFEERKKEKKLEIEVDRVKAESGAARARDEESQERDQRRRQMQRLRDMLVTEVERKREEHKHEAAKRIEAEKTFLREMEALVEKEKQEIEEQRVRRIKLARETHEAGRELAEAQRKAKQAAQELADKATISQDENHIERERLQQQRARESNKSLQQQLREQVAAKEARRLEERQREREAQDTEVAEDALEAMEERRAEREEKLERQAELKGFLDVQNQARRVMKRMGVVQTSINRPQSTSPWL